MCPSPRICDIEMIITKYVDGLEAHGTTVTRHMKDLLLAMKSVHSLMDLRMVSLREIGDSSVEKCLKCFRRRVS